MWSLLGFDIQIIHIFLNIFQIILAFIIVPLYFMLEHVPILFILLVITM